MNISKNSWHYRFLKIGGNTPPKDLCSYFWALVGRALWTVWMAAVIASIVGSLIFGPTLEIILVGVIAVVAVVAGATLLYWVVDKIIEKRPAKRSRKRHKAPKEPGLLKVRYRAWKEKHCPLLDFTE